MTVDQGGGAAASTGAGATDAPGRRPFPMRVVQAFFSPGDLVETLARHPAWIMAVILGAVLVIGQTLLIPADVWDAAFRETLLRQGREMPAGFAAGGTLMRVTTLTFGTLGYFLITFLFAGIVTLIFAFILGDEGMYRQYLAVTGHAWLIPALVGFLLLPLKISQGNPQLTLNLSSFLFFVPEGYLSRVATMLDLSQAWAWLVVAQGAHAIDRRRSFASAAVILMVVFVILAMLLALIPGIA